MNNVSTKFKGASCGSVMPLILNGDGVMLAMAVNKHMDKHQSMFGNLIVISKEMRKGKDVVGLWSITRYLEAKNNILFGDGLYIHPEAAWLPGKAGFHNWDVHENYSFMNDTPIILRANSTSSNIWLYCRYLFASKPEYMNFNEAGMLEFYKENHEKFHFSTIKGLANEGVDPLISMSSLRHYTKGSRYAQNCTF